VARKDLASAWACPADGPYDPKADGQSTARPHLLLRAPGDAGVAGRHVGGQAAEDQLAELVLDDAIPVVDGVDVVEHHDAPPRQRVLCGWPVSVAS